MSFYLAYGLFALIGLVVILGALLADIREQRKVKSDIEELIAEIRAETERVKQANWRKS